MSARNPCIKQTHADLTSFTWCGQRVAGWVFQSIDHAAYSKTIRPCRACVKAAIAHLRGKQA